MKYNVGLPGPFSSLNSLLHLPHLEGWVSASRLETLKSSCLDALVMLEGGMGRGWPPLPLWHDKWSGEKLQTGFFLGAELIARHKERPEGV